MTRQQDLPNEPTPLALSLRRQQDVRLRRYGLAVIATGLLPLSLGAEGGLYLWDIVGVVPSFDLMGALAPLLLGSLLVGLSFAPSITRLGQSLAALYLMAMTMVSLTASPLALESAFQGLLAFVGRRPLLVTAGLALVGAGADLRLQDAISSSRDLPQRCARALLIGGSALLVLVYLLPQRGVPFGWLLGERMVTTAWHGGARAVAGRVLFWTLGWTPALVAAGAIRAVWRPARQGILLGLAARYALPLLAALLCIPLLAADLNPHHALLQVRTAILLAAAIGVVSRSVEAATRHLLESPLPVTPPASSLARDVRLRALLARYLRLPAGTKVGVLEPSDVPPSHPWLQWLMRRRLAELTAETAGEPTHEDRPTREQARRLVAMLEARGHVEQDTAAPAAPHAPGERVPKTTRMTLWMLTGRWRLPATVAAVALVSVGALSAWLYRPPPDLRWTLGQPSAQADRLLGSTLPRYVVLLARRSDHRPRPTGAGAEATLLARRQATELVDSARSMDEELGTRVERLVTAAEAIDRTGQLWLTAVHGMNQRIRELGWPYYVDGNVLQLSSGRWSSPRRIFYVTTYRVERVRRFSANGSPLAALHVRRLDRLNIEGARLGAVRADEPFALVLLDGIERSVTDRLEALVERTSCGLATGAWAASSTPSEIDELCARTLLELARSRDLPLASAEGDPAQPLVALQIDATERHELQHQVDGPALPVPTELYRAAPWLNDEAARAVARELSAHLAELTADDSLAVAWRLADLSTYLIRPSGRGTYRWAAAVIASRLLGAPVLDGDGGVRMAQVLRLWQRVNERGDGLADWVAPTARQAHEELFGAPAATLAPAR